LKIFANQFQSPLDFLQLAEGTFYIAALAHQRTGAAKFFQKGGQLYCTNQIQNSQNSKQNRRKPNEKKRSGSIAGNA
jgi:hypothetical protein